MAIIAAVGGIFVAIFAALAVIMLLDVAGIRKIPDPEQRKWLFRGLIATVVLAVGGLGTAYFKSLEDLLNPEPSSTSSPTPGASAMSDGSPAPAASPSGEASSATAGDDPASQTPVSSEVQVFLERNELVRPQLPGDWRGRYPGCAVKSRTQEISKRSASKCLDELEGFNVNYLLVYQGAYDDYVPHVAALSYSQPAGAILDFLRADANGYMRATLPEARAYREASAPFGTDSDRLRRIAY